MEKRDDMPKELGYCAKYSFEDRRKYYEELVDPDLEDQDAYLVERAQWLQHHCFKGRLKTFLDVGCNSGGITRWLLDYYEEFVKLVGIDPAYKNIEIAKQRAASMLNPRKSSYLACGWEDYDNEFEFEGICCFEVLEHFLEEEQRNLILTMHEWLAPKGQCFICVPNPDGMWGTNNPDPHHIGLLSKNALERLIESVTDREPTTDFYVNNCAYLLTRWQK